MILVVGGTGFVGKNLVTHLHAKGMSVRVVSRAPDAEFLAVHAPGTSTVTLEQFLADPRSALYGITSVVYLASTSTPGSNLETPWHEARDTVETAMRIMSAVTQHGKAHVIYLSSGGTVYGETACDTIPEDTALNPISPYGLGKKMTETAIDYMVRTKGLRATVLRPSNPIGRWQVSVSQGVVGALMRAARQNTVFPMIGQGLAVRDYFDVRDLSHAIHMVIEQPEKSLGKIWNVGSGQGTSVREMLTLVQEVSGHQIEVENLPARAGDVSRGVLNTQAIRSTLSWAPQYDLRMSLEAIWNAG